MINFIPINESLVCAKPKNNVILNFRRNCLLKFFSIETSAKLNVNNISLLFQSKQKYSSSTDQQKISESFLLQTTYLNYESKRNILVDFTMLLSY